MEIPSSLVYSVYVERKRKFGSHKLIRRLLESALAVEGAKIEYWSGAIASRLSAQGSQGLDAAAACGCAARLSANGPHTPQTCNYTARLLLRWLLSTLIKKVSYCTAARE